MGPEIQELKALRKAVEKLANEVARIREYGIDVKINHIYPIYPVEHCCINPKSEEDAE